MLRRRGRAAGGAATLLLLGTAWVVVVAGLGAGEVVVYTAGDARAETAAAAAAHAAEAELAPRDDTAALSVALQAGQTACGPAERTAPAGCGPALAAARRVAEADGAALVEFAVGADPRDRGAEAAPGRVVVIATVEVVRGLPLLRRLCAAPAPPVRAICVARATAAARWG